jgi:hypothetical protein
MNDNGKYDPYAKPEENLSVAELSPVCTVKQAVARPDGIANSMLISGNIEVGCPESVPRPVDNSTVKYECSQPAKYEEVCSAVLLYSSLSHNTTSYQK